MKEFFNEFPSTVSKSVREDVLHFPPVNITDNATNYLVELLVPGYAKADFKVKLEDIFPDNIKFSVVPPVFVPVPELMISPSCSICLHDVVSAKLPVKRYKKACFSFILLDIYLLLKIVTECQTDIGSCCSLDC